jgi:hypothetical protein
MHQKFGILLFLCLVFSVAAVTRSQQLHFDKLNTPSPVSHYLISPSGSVLIDCSSVYFRSSDHGKSWIQVSSKNLGAVCFDSLGRLWSIVVDSLRYSNDDGVTWSGVQAVINNVDLLESSASSLFVSTISFGVASVQSILHSRDLGATWQKLDSYSDLEFLGYASIFAGPGDRAIWSFFPGGVSLWNRAIITRAKVHDDAMPRDGDARPLQRVLYTTDGYLFGIQDNFILRSSDSGANWYPIDSFARQGWPGKLYQAKVNYDQRTILAARFDSTAISTDHATTWTPMGLEFHRALTRILLLR